MWSHFFLTADLDKLVGRLGWRALGSPNSSSQKEDVLYFVSLWEELCLQDLNGFKEGVQKLIQKHYPTDHQTTLDQVTLFHGKPCPIVSHI